VLEREDELGGAIRTAELTEPGFHHDVFSAWHPLWVGGAAHAELAGELAARGLEYLNTEHPTATLFPDGEAAFLRESLHQHTKREWRDPKARSVAKYDLAVLYDPNEKTAPSSPTSMKHFARIAEKMSVDVEPITKRQLAELAEYDGLFIRETTSIDNHTYRFARRAWQEGMPVIDDPISMIRCTNKVFLMELLGSNQVPTPPTVAAVRQNASEIICEPFGT